ncbi:MAG: hypothetical protein F6K22_09270 [Okeania sp. SIO2F4]|uniref:hypothetical protein n=1 Tax=Okeania sp. SIO2F4 TaxID=2607790 RepID=UPI00142CA16B|nr:hypothetical protein [Okeania sp. SIO2F4]NES03023.1 hypothetical protein [Okeania sp. SIO2F4]
MMNLLPQKKSYYQRGLKAISIVEVDLPVAGTSEKARGFKTLIAFKVISSALRRLWPMLKKATCTYSLHSARQVVALKVV